MEEKNTDYVLVDYKTKMHTYTYTHGHAHITLLQWSYAVYLYLCFLLNFFSIVQTSINAGDDCLYSFAESLTHLVRVCYQHIYHVPAIILGTSDPCTPANFYWDLLQLLRGIIFIFLCMGFGWELEVITESLRLLATREYSFLFEG